MWLFAVLIGLGLLSPPVEEECAECAKGKKRGRKFPNRALEGACSRCLGNSVVVDLSMRKLADEMYEDLKKYLKSGTTYARDILEAKWPGLPVLVNSNIELHVQNPIIGEEMKDACDAQLLRSFTFRNEFEPIRASGRESNNADFVRDRSDDLQILCWHHINSKMVEREFSPLSMKIEFEERTVDQYSKIASCAATITEIEVPDGVDKASVSSLGSPFFFAQKGPAQITVSVFDPCHPRHDLIPEYLESFCRAAECCGVKRMVGCDLSCRTHSHPDETRGWRRQNVFPDSFRKVKVTVFNKPALCTLQAKFHRTAQAVVVTFTPLVRGILARRYAGKEPPNGLTDKLRKTEDVLEQLEIIGTWSDKPLPESKKPKDAKKNKKRVEESGDVKSFSCSDPACHAKHKTEKAAKNHGFTKVEKTDRTPRGERSTTTSRGRSPHRSRGRSSRSRSASKNARRANLVTKKDLKEAYGTDDFHDIIKIMREETGSKAKFDVYGSVKLFDKGKLKSGKTADDVPLFR